MDLRDGIRRMKLAAVGLAGVAWLLLSVQAAHGGPCPPGTGCYKKGRQCLCAPGAGGTCPTCCVEGCVVMPPYSCCDLGGGGTDPGKPTPFHPAP